MEDVQESIPTNFLTNLINIDMAVTQDRVDTLITFIEQTENPRSVTNVQVAQILDFFNQTVKYVESVMKGELSKAAAAADNAASAASSLAKSYNEWQGQVSVLKEVLTAFKVSRDATAVKADFTYASLADGHTWVADNQSFLNGATEALAGVMTAQQVKDLNKALSQLRWIDAIKTLIGVTSSDPEKPGESALVKRVEFLETKTDKLTAIRVESEEEMEKLIASGAVKDGQAYYTEED